MKALLFGGTDVYKRQVEEANAEIRTITEQNAGSESQLAVLQNETEHANEQIRSASDELTRAGEGAKGITQEADEHKAEITQLQTCLLYTSRCV